MKTPRTQINTLILQSVSRILDENAGIKEPLVLVDEAVRLVNASPDLDVQKCHKDLLWMASTGEVNRQLKLRRIENHADRPDLPLFATEIMEIYIPCRLPERDVERYRGDGDEESRRLDMAEDDENGADRGEDQGEETISAVCKVRDAPRIAVNIQLRERQIKNMRRANRSFDRWEARREKVKDYWDNHPDLTFGEVTAALGLI